MAEVRAVLMDIDGVLSVSWRPLPGAVDVLRSLRDDGYGIALLTNTSSRTREWIAGTLAEAGFPVTAGDIFTVAALTSRYLAQNHPGASCMLLNDGDIGADLTGVTLVDGDDAAPDVVILGGAGPPFSYQALNRAFGHLRRGATLIAMNQNMYWRTDEGLQLDTGAFLAGLERAAGVQAKVTGKPAAEFFAAALAALGASAEQAVMVGDDLEGDVLAGQRAGLTGVLVRTGKFTPEVLQDARAQPDLVIDSIADLPAFLAG
jgi:HAD superfamily hydrolase (TIGR01458 family)